MEPKSIKRLNDVETPEQLQKASMFDIARNIHIIIGDGGRCMCGKYGEESVTCQEIFARKSSMFRAWLIGAQMTEEHGGEPVTPGQKVHYPCGCSASAGSPNYCPTHNPEQILKDLDALPPWPWKKEQTNNFIQWATRSLRGLAMMAMPKQAEIPPELKEMQEMWK